MATEKKAPAKKAPAAAEKAAAPAKKVAAAAKKAVAAPVKVEVAPVAKKAAAPAAKKAAAPAKKKAAAVAAPEVVAAPVAVAKPAAKKAAASKKAAAKAAEPEVKVSAFKKLLTPSKDLAAIIGKGPFPRTEVVKKIWEYIKKHKLQDAVDKRMINADAKLKAIFNKAQASMFEMTKMISSHLK